MAARHNSGASTTARPSAKLARNGSHLRIQARTAGSRSAGPPCYSTTRLQELDLQSVEVFFVHQHFVK